MSWFDELQRISGKREEPELISPPDYTAPRPFEGDDTLGGLKRGYYNTASSFASTLGNTGAAADLEVEAAGIPRRFNSWRDIDPLSLDVLDYVQQTGGEQIGPMGLMAAGAVPGLLAKAPVLARAGAGAVSSAMQYGEMAKELRSIGKEPDAATAGVSLLQGGLDVFGLENFGRGILQSALGEQIKAGAAASATRRTLRGAALGGVSATTSELLPELAQESLAIVNRERLQPGYMQGSPSEVGARLSETAAATAAFAAPPGLAAGAGGALFTKPSAPTLPTEFPAAPKPPEASTSVQTTDLAQQPSIPGTSTMTTPPSDFTPPGAAHEEANQASTNETTEQRQEPPPLLTEPTPPPRSSWQPHSQRESNAAITYRVLQENGIPPHVAAGIVGSLSGESGRGLNPTALNPDGSESYGIAQWLGSRKKGLLDFAKREGTSASSLQTQLRYLLKELHDPKLERDAFDRVLQAKDEREAAYLFTKYFERPAKWAFNSSIGTRQDNATRMLQGGLTAPSGTYSGNKPRVYGGPRDPDNFDDAPRIRSSLGPAVTSGQTRSLDRNAVDEETTDVTAEAPVFEDMPNASVVGQAYDSDGHELTKDAAISENPNVFRTIISGDEGDTKYSGSRVSKAFSAIFPNSVTQQKTDGPTLYHVNLDLDRASARTDADVERLQQALNTSMTDEGIDITDRMAQSGRLVRRAKAILEAIAGADKSDPKSKLMFLHDAVRGDKDPEKHVEVGMTRAGLAQLGRAVSDEQYDNTPQGDYDAAVDGAAYWLTQGFRPADRFRIGTDAEGVRQRVRISDDELMRGLLGERPATKPLWDSMDALHDPDNPDPHGARRPVTSPFEGPPRQQTAAERGFAWDEFSHPEFADPISEEERIAMRLEDPAGLGFEGPVRPTEGGKGKWKKPKSKIRDHLSFLEQEHSPIQRALLRELVKRAKPLLPSIKERYPEAYLGEKRILHETVAYRQAAAQLRKEGLDKISAGEHTATPRDLNDSVRVALHEIKTYEREKERSDTKAATAEERGDSSVELRINPEGEDLVIQTLSEQGVKLEDAEQEKRITQFKRDADRLRKKITRLKEADAKAREAKVAEIEADKRIAPEYKQRAIDDAMVTLDMEYSRKVELLLAGREFEEANLIDYFNELKQHVSRPRVEGEELITTPDRDVTQPLMLIETAKGKEVLGNELRAVTGSVLATNVPRSLAMIVNDVLHHIGLNIQTRMISRGSIQAHIDALTEQRRDLYQRTVFASHALARAKRGAKTKFQADLRRAERNLRELDHELNELREAQDNPTWLFRAIYNDHYTLAENRVPIILVGDIGDRPVNLLPAALAHEVGHVVQRAWFDQLKPEDQAGIVKELMGEGQVDPDMLAEAFANRFAEWYATRRKLQTTSNAARKAGKWGRLEQAFHDFHDVLKRVWETIRTMGARFVDVQNIMLGKLDPKDPADRAVLLRAEATEFAAKYPTFDEFLSTMVGFGGNMPDAKLWKNPRWRQLVFDPILAMPAQQRVKWPSSNAELVAAAGDTEAGAFAEYEAEEGAQPEATQPSTPSAPSPQDQTLALLRQAFPASALEYDDAAHAYKVNGKVLPSVTQLKSLLDVFKFDAEGVALRMAGGDKEAAKRIQDSWKADAEEGTAIHKALEKALADPTDTSVHQSLRDLAAKLKARGMVLSEVPVWDGEKAGTIDVLVVRPDGRLEIYDLKTLVEKHNPHSLPSEYERKYKGGESKAEGHRLQLLMYGDILSQAGGSVAGTYVIPVRRDSLALMRRDDGTSVISARPSKITQDYFRQIKAKLAESSAPSPRADAIEQALKIRGQNRMSFENGVVHLIRATKPGEKVTIGKSRLEFEQKIEAAAISEALRSHGYELRNLEFSPGLKQGTSVAQAEVWPIGITVDGIGRVLSTYSDGLFQVDLKELERKIRTEGLSNAFHPWSIDIEEMRREIQATQHDGSATAPKATGAAQPSIPSAPTPRAEVPADVADIVKRGKELLPGILARTAPAPFHDMSIDEFDQRVRQAASAAAARAQRYASGTRVAQSAVVADYKKRFKGTWDAMARIGRTVFQADGTRLRNLADGRFAGVGNIIAPPMGKRMDQIQLRAIPFQRVNDVVIGTTRIFAPLHDLIGMERRRLRDEYHVFPLLNEIIELHQQDQAAYDDLLENLWDEQAPTRSALAQRIRTFYKDILKELVAAGISFDATPGPNANDPTHGPTKLKIAEREGYFTKMPDIDKMLAEPDEVIEAFTKAYQARLDKGLELPENEHGIPYATAREAAEAQHYRTVTGVYDDVFTDLAQQKETGLRGPAFPQARSRPFSNEEYQQFGLTRWLERDIAKVISTYLDTSARRAATQRAFGFPLGIRDNIQASAALEERFRLARLDPSLMHTPTAALELLIHEAERDGLLNRDGVKEAYTLVRSALGQLNVGRSPRGRRWMNRLVALETLNTMSGSALMQLSDFGINLWRGENLGRDLGNLAKLFDGTTREQQRKILEMLGMAADHMAQHAYLTDVGTTNDPLAEGSRKVTEFMFKYNGMQKLSEYSMMLASIIGQDYMRDYARQATDATLPQAQRDKALGRLKELHPDLTPDDVLNGDLENDIRPDRRIRLRYALRRYINTSHIHDQHGYTSQIFNDWRFKPLTMLKGFMMKFHNIVLKLMWERMKEQPDLRHAVMPFVTLAICTMPLAAMGLYAKDLVRRKIPAAMGFKTKRKHKDRTPEQWIHDSFMATGMGGMYLGVMDSMFEAPQHGMPALVALGGPPITHGYTMMTRTADEWVPASIPGLNIFPAAKSGLRSELRDTFGWGVRDDEE